MHRYRSPYSPRAFGLRFGGALAAFVFVAMPRSTVVTAFQPALTRRQQHMRFSFRTALDQLRLEVFDFPWQIRHRAVTGAAHRVVVVFGRPALGLRQFATFATSSMPVSFGLPSSSVKPNSAACSRSPFLIASFRLLLLPCVTASHALTAAASLGA
jgi:hypothetical protein